MELDSPTSITVAARKDVVATELLIPLSHDDYYLIRNRHTRQSWAFSKFAPTTHARVVCHAAVLNQKNRAFCEYMMKSALAEASPTATAGDRVLGKFGFDANGDIEDIAYILKVIHGGNAINASTPAPDGSSTNSPDDLSLTGLVLNIENNPIDDSRDKPWVVRMRVEEIRRGALTGGAFSFRIHSPARSGVAVGSRCVIQATREGSGYIVREPECVPRSKE